MLSLSKSNFDPPYCLGALYALACRSDAVILTLFVLEFSFVSFVKTYPLPDDAMGDLITNDGEDQQWMDQSSARLFEKSRIKVLQGTQ